MARPKKQTVDYFPHVCKHGKTIFILEQKYGNDGYAFWFKLLEMLGGTEGHYLHFENGEDWEFLQAKTHMGGDKCEEILNLLATLGAVDKELWREHRAVWSDNFVQNISDAYRNRTVDIPEKPSFQRKKSASNGQSDVRNPQTKLEYSKQDDTRENNMSAAGELADRLRDWITKNNPKARVPDSLQKWTLEIERMIRIDERTAGEIQAVIDYSQQHEFWWKNIMSADKLRKQYDRLINEMASDKKKTNKKPPGWTTLKEWYEEGVEIDEQAGVHEDHGFPDGSS